MSTVYFLIAFYFSESKSLTWIATDTNLYVCLCNGGVI